MCDCIKEIDVLLAEKNGRLGLTIRIHEGLMQGVPTILVEKCEPRGKKPPAMLPSYCPFCGEKYPGRDNAPESESYRLRTSNTELLAACERALEFLEPFDQPGLSLGLGSEALTQIRATIANARGEA